ncbi:lysophospholipid acyltransferase family protein [Tropicimonas sp.]|uniref:lysophospholipid acyltransferase family protein n=1 Tax=Tropicimonas sp. TaxID=2067044 RepID=UPI003A8C21A6
MLQYLRSLIFIVQMYLMMVLMALAFTPFVLIHRPLAFTACRTYCRWVRWTAAWMIGLRSEVRGDTPTGECLIASKHQSFFDIIMIVSEVPRPKFIMKAELRWVPIVGWYAIWIGCVPVDRGKRGRAIEEMKQRVEAGRSAPGPLIIYPQGTRVAPGAQLPYKIGSGVLYEQLGQICVPAATNVGVFWPRRNILRKPGLAVVEFLPVIEPGLPRDTFMAELERVVEEASNRLMEAAGFHAAH